MSIILDIVPLGSVWPGCWPDFHNEPSLKVTNGKKQYTKKETKQQTIYVQYSCTPSILDFLFFQSCMRYSCLYLFLILLVMNEQILKHLFQTHWYGCCGFFFINFFYRGSVPIQRLCFHKVRASYIYWTRTFYQVIISSFSWYTIHRTGVIASLSSWLLSSFLFMFYLKKNTYLRVSVSVSDRLALIKPNAVQ